MSDQVVVFIRNNSNADLGILDGTTESGGKKQCVIHGLNVFIPAGTVYTDANGSVWRTIVSASMVFFMNTVDPQEAIRLSVPMNRWRYVDDMGNQYVGGGDVPANAKFVGFFGVSQCLVNDSGNRAGILNATANRVESIRHLQRMEEELAAAQQVIATMRTAAEAHQQALEQLRAENLVLRGRTGDEEAKKTLGRMEQKAKEKGSSTAR